MNKSISVLVFLIFMAVAITGFADIASAAELDAGPDAEAAESTAVSMQMEKEAAKEAPEFVPVTEDLLPLNTRIISISARNTPLKDILYTVGENTGLNIVMETGVNPELPLTVTLKEVAADEALNIIFSSADYYYELEGNVLIVKALDTMIFEFMHPAVTQNYETAVGGDLLGAQDDVGDMKGKVHQEISLDSDDLWTKLQESLTGIVTKGTVDINRMSGTILVTATRKNLKSVEEYLTYFKKVMSRRVLIEARIVEVTLSDNLKYGIDWTFFDDSSLEFTDSTGASLVKDSQFSIDEAGNTIYPDRILNLATSAFTDVVGTSEGFVVNVIQRNFTAMLKALQTQGETTVLSNPRIGVLNGQTALLSVGTQKSFVSKVERTVTEKTDTVAEKTVYDPTVESILSGVMLGLAPSISDTGEVTLTITPIIANLINDPDDPLDLTTFGDVTIFLPEVALKELSTIIKVKDGEMIVIGGHIDKREGVVDNQVPLLGSIPIIGNLFKSHSKTEESTELVIMLKTTVEM